MTKTTTKPAIEIIDVHKEFILPQSKSTSFKQVAVNIVRENKKTTQKVLDGVSFTINQGDFFGIVGRNGSGKSTLLKMIAGVYTPTKGEIKVHGGLTPFIELGVGFNPELSGRDNVYLNGALLGYTRREMDEMYDDIVDFAELGPFMDQKLKNYSSGMQVRLAFSIAIKAKNDILIFDEVLAVGDEAFQRKCMDVFREYRRKKQTVVLVTHSMSTVRDLCTRGLLLSDGKVVSIGSVKRIADAYTFINQADSPKIEETAVVQEKGRAISITGNEPSYNIGETIKLYIRWPDEYDVHQVSVAIFSEKGEYIFGSSTDGKIHVAPNGMDYSAELKLGAGAYNITVAIKDKNAKVIERVEKIASFYIYDDFKTEVGGITRLDYEYTKPSKKPNSV